jgi:hypothetical protein
MVYHVYRNHFLFDYRISIPRPDLQALCIICARNIQAISPEGAYIASSDLARISPASRLLLIVYECCSNLNKDNI